MTQLYDERTSPLFAAKRAQGGALGLAALIETARQSLVQPLLAWHRRQRTYRELMSLDDRQLADIGVSRGDIQNNPVSYARLTAHSAR